MTSVVSKYISVFNAKQFKESVSEPSSSNVYLTFGKVTPWNNESSPDQANTSFSSYYEVWRNMVGAKRLTGNEIRHCVPRFDWTANSVYYAYDNLTDSNELKNGTNQFYVLTDDFNVYKCLANNYGANSSTKPTSTITTSSFQTSDGYVWKYMYTLTAEERLRFLTPLYMPVKTLAFDDNSTQWQVQDNSIEGAIHSIVLTNAGSGYTSNNITITITGDGTDCNAYAVRNVTTNTISNIVVDNKGAQYTFANVTITGDGTNANARAIISPTLGHGSDPLTELGGSNLILNPQFFSSESDTIITNNDFRQISLLEDPLKFGSTEVMSNTVVDQTLTLTLSGDIAINYIEDEYVYQGANLSSSTFKGIVAKWDSTNNIIKLVNTEGSPTYDLIIGDTSGSNKFLSYIQNPGFKKFTGKLLYINNIEPIERAIDQTENFQIILKF